MAVHNRKRGGRTTPRKPRGESFRDGDVNMPPRLAPTSVGMMKDVEQGEKIIRCRFTQPNVQFTQSMTYAHWRMFCSDLEKLMEGEEIERERVEGSGLVIPGGRDVERLTRGEGPG